LLSLIELSAGVTHTVDGRNAVDMVHMVFNKIKHRRWLWRLRDLKEGERIG